LKHLFRVGVISTVFIIACIAYSYLGNYKSEKPSSFAALQSTTVFDLIPPSSGWSRMTPAKGSSDVQAEIFTTQSILGLSTEESGNNYDKVITVSEFENDSYIDTPERLIGEVFSEESNFFLDNAYRKQLNVGEFIDPNDFETLSPMSQVADERNIGLFIDINSVEPELLRPQNIGAVMLIDSSL
jgi:hypothetical protein